MSEQYIKPNIPSKSFCTLPWTHLNIQPNGDIYPCCMAPYNKPIGNISKTTLEEIWNGDDMKNIRKEMLSGKRPETCKRCFLLEDNNIISPRTHHNHFFKDRIEHFVENTNPETGEFNEFKLKYWDFRWSNRCNFKCRMCGVFSSSKWYEDAKVIHGHDSETKGVYQFNINGKENVFDLVDKFIYDVEEIYFAGGEPLVMDENYLILEKLIEAGRTDVTLRYNTNFSHLTYKKWDLFDMWMKFQNDPKGSVSLFASLDAAGDLAELVRSGTNWPKVEENLKKCINAGINVVFSPTVSLLNMYHIDKLIEAAERVGLNPNSFSVHNLLTDPLYYDIRLLPDYLKESFINKLKNYKENGCPINFKIIVQKIIDVWGDYINQEFSGDRFYWEKELIRITEGLDNLRNEDFLLVNPQYTEWFADIKKRIGNGII